MAIQELLDRLHQQLSAPNINENQQDEWSRKQASQVFDQATGIIGLYSHYKKDEASHTRGITISLAPTPESESEAQLYIGKSQDETTVFVRFTDTDIPDTDNDPHRLEFVLTDSWIQIIENGAIRPNMDFELFAEHATFLHHMLSEIEHGLA